MGELTDRLMRGAFLLITILALGAWLAFTAEDATGASISEGQTLFNSSCNGCHSGGAILNGKNLSVDQIIAALDAGPGSMPSYSSTFTADQKLSIGCYVKSAFMGGIPTSENRCPATPTATTTSTTSTTSTTVSSTTSSTTATTSSTTSTTTPTTTSSTTSTTTPSSQQSGSGTAYPAGPAGTVHLDVVGGRLVLVSVDSTWTWKVEEDEGDEIEIVFSSEAGRVKFEAEYEHGLVKTEVDVYRQESGHDDDDEHRGSHDDDDDDEHRSGREHDDD